MIVKKLTWYSTNKIYRYNVDVVITAGREQFMFSSPWAGNLALCTRTEIDHNNKLVKYRIDFGNQHIIGSAIDNSGVVERVKRYIKRDYAGYNSEFGYTVEFDEHPDMFFGSDQIVLTIKK